MGGVGRVRFLKKEWCWGRFLINGVGWFDFFVYGSGVVGTFLISGLRERVFWGWGVGRVHSMLACWRFLGHFFFEGV